MKPEPSQRAMGSRRHRLAGFLWLAALLFWLPIEDTKVIIPFLLGLWLSSWLVILSAIRWAAEWTFWRVTFLALLAGIITPIVAALMMVFKTGIHAHGFSEYTTSQFSSVLSVLPFSATLGLVFGSALFWGNAYLKRMRGNSQ